MSIATAISDLQDRVEDAYDALEAKGATIPATKNTANLPATIASVPTGHDITPLLNPSPSATGLTFYDDTLTTIRPQAFAYTFDNFVEINLPNVTRTCTVSSKTPSSAATWSNLFTRTNSIKRIYMPKFYNTSTGTIRAQFQYDTNLEEVDFRQCTGGGSTTASAPRLFYQTGIKKITFGKIQLYEYEFYETTGLEELILPNCIDIHGTTPLYGCTNLKKLEMMIPRIDQQPYTAQSTCTALKNVKLTNITATGAGMTNSYTDGGLTTMFPYVENLEVSIQLNTYLSDKGQPFLNCTTLKELTINATEGIIFGFKGCTNLEHITINPTNGADWVQSISKCAEAFSGCTKLKRIDIYGTLNYVLPTGGTNWNSLYGVTDCHIYLHDTPSSGSFLRNLNERSDIPHSTVFHNMPAQTKYVWSDGDNAWIVVDDV